MAAEISFEYKGILEGKYTEGIISALNRDEASFKLKSQRIIITSLILVKEQKKPEAKKKSSGGFSLFGGKAKPKDVMIFVKKRANVLFLSMEHRSIIHQLLVRKFAIKHFSIYTFA